MSTSETLRKILIAGSEVARLSKLYGTKPMTIHSEDLREADFAWLRETLAEHEGEAGAKAIIGRILSLLSSIKEGGGEVLSAVAPLASPSVASRLPEPGPAMPLSDADSCEVTVRVNGDDILTIGVLSGYLAGVSDIERYANFVRAAGKHLLAFIGPVDPPPCWFCGGTGEAIAPDQGGGPLPCDMCQPADESSQYLSDTREVSNGREATGGRPNQKTSHKDSQ